ncbi:hypothetical protein M2092_002224 [Fusobacterium sp. PH5-44]
MNNNYIVNDQFKYNIFEVFSLDNYNSIEIERNKQKDIFTLNKSIQDKYISNLIRIINHYYLKKINNCQNNKIQEYGNKNFSSENINITINSCKHMNNSLLINKINSIFIIFIILLSIIYGIIFLLMFSSYEFLIFLTFIGFVIIIFLLLPIFKFINYNHFLNNAYRNFLNYTILEKPNLYFGLSKLLFYGFIPFTGTIRSTSADSNYEKRLSYKNGHLNGEQSLISNNEQKIFITLL